MKKKIIFTYYLNSEWLVLPSATFDIFNLFQYNILRYYASPSIAKVPVYFVTSVLHLRYCFNKPVALKRKWTDWFWCIWLSLQPYFWMKLVHNTTLIQFIIKYIWQLINPYFSWISQQCVTSKTKLSVSVCCPFHL